MKLAYKLCAILILISGNILVAGSDDINIEVNDRNDIFSEKNEIKKIDIKNVLTKENIEELSAKQIKMDAKTFKLLCTKFDIKENVAWKFICSTGKLCEQTFYMVSGTFLLYIATIMAYEKCEDGCDNAEYTKVVAIYLAGLSSVLQGGAAKLFKYLGTAFWGCFCSEPKKKLKAE